IRSPRHKDTVTVEESDGDRTVTDGTPLRSADTRARVPARVPVPVSVPVESSISLEMDETDVGSRVLQECRISSWRVREAIEAQARMELSDGRALGDVAAEMVSSWNAYQ